MTTAISIYISVFPLIRHIHVYVCMQIVATALRRVYHKRNFDELLQAPASTFAIRKVGSWISFYFGDTLVIDVLSLTSNAQISHLLKKHPFIIFIKSFACYQSTSITTTIYIISLKTTRACYLSLLISQYFFWKRA